MSSEHRKAYWREYQRKRRAEETPEEREERRKYYQAMYLLRKANETAEQREKRLVYGRAYQRDLRRKRNIKNLAGK